MWAHKQANSQGIDLMRKAPERADSRVPFLVGGQTLKSSLPRYFGAQGAQACPPAGFFEAGRFCRIALAAGT